MKKLRVGVLMGGLSSERSISIKTGQAIVHALGLRGYNVVPIDVREDVAQLLVSESIEVAFIALHGVFGEDGCMQGMLEIMGIPYTGSGVLASALAMDKALTKKVFVNHQIPTPKWIEINSSDLAREEFSLAFDFPVVVKPNTQGSTVGIHIVPEARQLSEALRDSARYDHTLLLEEYIPGVEATVGILNGEALPVVEIVPQSGFYDFDAKYTAGQSNCFIPARIDDALARECQRLGLLAYEAVGCEGVARADFRIDPDGRCLMLEINTVPGMTATSLVPMAAKEVGLSFEDVCERILDGASLKVPREALA